VSVSVCAKPLPCTPPQLVGFSYLIWWELSWDVMEPIAYITSVSYSLIAYVYFLATRTPCEQKEFVEYWVRCLLVGLLCWVLAAVGCLSGARTVSSGGLRRSVGCPAIEDPNPQTPAAPQIHISATTTCNNRSSSSWRRQWLPPASAWTSIRT
jgi:hypothetical protein